MTLVLSLAGCDAKDSGSSSQDDASTAEHRGDQLDKPKLQIGKVDGLADSVDVDAAKQAFGCDAPRDAPAKRACRGLAAFEKGGKVHSYPSDGATVYASLWDCVKPHAMVTFEIAGLSAGTPPGDADEAHRAPGVIKSFLQARVRNDGVAETADVIIGQLRDGKPRPELTPAQAGSTVLPKEWSDWEEKWAGFEMDEIRTVQSEGESLLERPDSLGSASAYWREADGTLVRVAPPFGDRGWCVNHFFPLPG